MSNKALKISIIAGAAHALSAVTALVFYLILKFGAVGIAQVPFLIFLALFIVILAFAGLVIFVIQFFCAVGIIVTGVLKKRKLCAFFCALPLLADLVAVFFAASFGFAFITDGTGGSGILIGMDLLLLSALSLAGIVLSIIAMIRNLSKKYDYQAQ